jgi:hypothetical protein
MTQLSGRIGADYGDEDYTGKDDIPGPQTLVCQGRYSLIYVRLIVSEGQA